MALILLLGILFLHFRHPVRVLLTLTPLVSSILWLLGGMAIFKIQINVMNVAVTPMLLGIGIDDAVHMLNAYLHEAKRDLQRVFVLTGKAVALTTLTTCIGFGSLAFADHPGLSSMGTLAIWGVSLAFLSTVTFLPALILAFRKYLQ
jgi:predicted RND superfamily exporter protein